MPEPRDADIHFVHVEDRATISTEIYFDWRQLGAHFIQAGSDQQAEFLRGLLHATQELGAYMAGRQYCYIADEFKLQYATRICVAKELRALATYLGDDEDG